MLNFRFAWDSAEAVEYLGPPALKKTEQRILPRDFNERLIYYTVNQVDSTISYYRMNVKKDAFRVIKNLPITIYEFDITDITDLIYLDSGDYLLDVGLLKSDSLYSIYQVKIDKNGVVIPNSSI
ncbi:hypothetical protein JXI42_00660 [bacterium]|nr:hypothetical protein [bacterium]